MHNMMSGCAQKKKRCVTFQILKDSTCKYTLVKRPNPVSEIYKGTVGYVAQVGVSAKLSRGQGDIVRVFFLFESRRGNGTKLFTSLKHNPVDTMRTVIVYCFIVITYYCIDSRNVKTPLRFHSSRDNVALSWLSSYGVGSGKSSASRRLSKYGCSSASSAVSLSSPSRTSIFSSRSIPVNSQRNGKKSTDLLREGEFHEAVRYWTKSGKINKENRSDVFSHLCGKP